MEYQFGITMNTIRNILKHMLDIMRDNEMIRASIGRLLRWFIAGAYEDDERRARAVDVRARDGVGGSGARLVPRHPGFGYQPWPIGVPLGGPPNQGSGGIK